MWTDMVIRDVRVHRLPARREERASARPFGAAPSASIGLFEVGRGGIEPPTPRFSAACSAGLSYLPGR
jgi:hypothetical protein